MAYNSSSIKLLDKTMLDALRDDPYKNIYTGKLKKPSSLIHNIQKTKKLVKISIDEKLKKYYKEFERKHISNMFDNYINLNNSKILNESTPEKKILEVIEKKPKFKKDDFENILTRKTNFKWKTIDKFKIPGSSSNFDLSINSSQKNLNYLSSYKSTYIKSSSIENNQKHLSSNSFFNKNGKIDSDIYDGNKLNDKDVQNDKVIFKKISEIKSSLKNFEPERLNKTNGFTFNKSPINRSLKIIKSNETCEEISKYIENRNGSIPFRNKYCLKRFEIKSKNI